MAKNQIITNRYGRRILVLIEPAYIEKIDEIQYEDFDATFVNFTPGYSVNISIVWSVLPMLKNKTWLKPTFLHSNFKERFMHFADVVDGFAESPLDEEMTKRIEEIEELIENSGVPRKREKVRITEELFINFCRFCLSRGITSMYNNSMKYYGKGYTQMLYTLFGENYFIDTAIRFNQILSDMGYVREKRFVERIHICPICNNSHLFFIECCPTCKSSAIKNEPVIHHFRCANISPESSYEFDGELRCPKCKRFLHHIGVDYDRPASVYTCETCSNTFANPMMRVICTSCKRTFVPEDLGTFNIREFEFTEEGIRAMVSDEIKLNMSRNVFIGYSDFEGFTRTMRLNIMMKSKSPGASVLVARMPLPKSSAIDDQQRHEVIIQVLLAHLTDYKITMNNGFAYAMKVLPDTRKMYDSVLSRMRNAFGEAVGVNIGSGEDSLYGFETFLYQQGVNIHEFLENINSNN